MVTITDSSGTLAATDLSGIGAKTSGAVTVSNAITISGSQSELTNALVHATKSVTAATAVVTISDSAYAVSDAKLNASDLSAIGGKTSGDVTASAAIRMRGTQAEVKAALIGGDSIIAGAAGTTAEITDDVSAAEGAEIVDVNNVTGIFEGGVLDAFASLVTVGAGATSGNLNKIVGQDPDVNITFSDGAGTLAATDLSDIGAKTSGAVTVMSVIQISGPTTVSRIAYGECGK